MFNSFNNSYNLFGTHPWALPAFFLLIAWSLYWKGTALWKASKKNQPVWFVILLLINTAGLLEILYIYYFSKKSSREEENKEEQN